MGVCPEAMAAEQISQAMVIPDSRIVSIGLVFSICSRSLLRWLRARMMDLRDARFSLVSEQFRMDIVALILRRFICFHRDAMRVGPGVLTDARHLPGNFYVRLVAFDHKSVV